MTRLILRLYDYIREHRKVGIFSFLACTAILLLLVFRVEYKEDISDFLPLEGKQNEALNIYQGISGADKILAVFQYADSTKTDVDAITRAIDCFIDNVNETDTSRVIKNMISQIDLGEVTAVTDFIYDNIPFFLIDSDYARIDSLLETDNYIAEQLAKDKQMLMFPSGGLFTENIERDPLDLFITAVKSLQQNINDINYEMYDGYIFSPDGKKAFVMVDSPFGASETENNARLVNMLNRCADATTKNFTDMDIHIIGGPVIAVGNAQRIKADSILAVSCAMMLILILLFVAFRNVRNLLLITVSICWGWLFGFGCLSLVHHQISVIVLGISSVVIGIAVNYPLHLIAHLSHTPEKRIAVSEIVAPLLVGNITTVGAFLALVPLQSVALRDLGLFSSFLLIGTIIFVLLYLPHIAKSEQRATQTFFSKIGDITLENKPYIVWAVTILTIIFGYYSFQTEFDANMANINYMTEEQKADMVYFQNMMKNENYFTKLYVVSSAQTMDDALDKSMNTQSSFHQLKDNGIKGIATCSRFLCSSKEQSRRLSLWKKFISRHRKTIETSLRNEGNILGFQQNSFNYFYGVLDGDYQVRPFSFFQPLESFFSGYINSSRNGDCNVVDVLSVEKTNVDYIKELLGEQGIYSFDALSMNSAIANNLSNDFNYIGWACSCIVFFFLWLSMGSIELAVLSFIPMAVSWVWILGLMSIFGIQFNIVNIILATFIFGQGDDYTIFMTEGSCYEYAYRRKILSSYKNSIVISALIMFIGIGALILARHPALHSLGEVTIVGMLSVVLMAYILPPLIYKWLVSYKGQYRLRPLSLRPLMLMLLCAVIYFFQLLTVYILGVFLFVLQKRTDSHLFFFRRYIQRLYAFDLKHICGVKLNINNMFHEDFDRPSMIISNHQSMLDTAVFMMLTPRSILVSNDHVSQNPVIKYIYKWMGFVTLSAAMKNMHSLQSLVEKGYSLVMFPEGGRNPKSSILRFHKGAFYIAEQLKLDIVPVLLHGLNHVLPRNSIAVFKGEITISVHQRITIDNQTMGCGYVERTKALHGYYLHEYKKLAERIETATYYKGLVIDRYRYKGYDITHAVTKNIKKYRCYSQWIDFKYNSEFVVIIDNGYGEFALLFALVHPSIHVISVSSDADMVSILKYSAEGVVENLCATDSLPVVNDRTIIFLVNPTKGREDIYKDCKKIMITPQEA